MKPHHHKLKLLNDIIHSCIFISIVYFSAKILVSNLKEIRQESVIGTVFLIFLWLLLFIYALNNNDKFIRRYEGSWQ